MQGQSVKTHLSMKIFLKDLLNNLVGALLRFRQGKFCIMVDIEKMFHQVMVGHKGTDALRFILRSNRDENFRDI